MKILFIIYSFPPEIIAGWQLFTKELAEEFSILGHKVTVIVSRSNSFQIRQMPIGTADTATGSTDTVLSIANKQLKVIRIPTLPIPFIRYIFELYATLLFAILEFPDVIFGMSLSPGGIISSFLGKAFKTKNFLYIIGREFIEGPQFFRQFVSNIFSRLSSKIICATDFAKNTLPTSRILYNKICVCPIFINEFKDLKSNVFTNCNDQKDKKIILYAGRIIEEKGLDMLIKAFSLIYNKYNIYLRIIGTGNKEQEYKNLAWKLLKKETYEFLGFKNQEELPKYFYNAYLLVLPSRSETFGRIILEANLHRLPVVATNVMGIPSVVKNNENGILVEPNPEAIADGIEKLLINNDLHNRIKQNTKKYAEQFTKKRIIKRLLKIMNEV